MPKLDTTPHPLRPFIFHGVDLDYGRGDEALGDCPFCGKESKLSVNSLTGQWRCLSCNIGEQRQGKVVSGGNVRTFLQLLLDLSPDNTQHHEQLRLDKGLLYTSSLSHWGIRLSAFTGELIVPTYKPGTGKLDQVYRYLCDYSSGKQRWMPTPREKVSSTHNNGQPTESFGHGIFGVHLWDQDKPDVWVCEGLFDAIALWEIMRVVHIEGNSASHHHSSVTDVRLTYTANESDSLFGRTNIIAVPSVTTFDQSWCRLLAGKNVYLCYDNDHPRDRTSNTDPPRTVHVYPMGIVGMRSVCQILAHSEESPESVSYLQWGTDSDDTDGQGGIYTGFNLSLPSGWDIRDELCSWETLPIRIVQLVGIIERLAVIPADWISGRSFDDEESGKTRLQPLPCRSWQEVVDAFSKCMEWIEGLDRVLSIMLACISSTKTVGTKLWIKAIGPASSGKTVLCEAISVARKYVYPKSILTGFHSGFKLKGQTENLSLILKINGKTLVTKDADTIMQLPNRAKVFSEARDLFDGASRTEYRNDMGQDHECINVTWIIAGTSAIAEADESELGQRFLTSIMFDEIDEDLEDRISLRAAHTTNRNMSFESNGRAESFDSPEMTLSKQLTGGYVCYLRDNAQSLLDDILFPESRLRECVRLGKFTAYMRARPSKKQDEKAERELCVRLVQQMVKLAKCLAVVLNRSEVDQEVMRRVRQTALDTSRGKVLDVCSMLYRMDDSGSTSAGIAYICKYPEVDVDSVLRFLLRMKPPVVEKFSETIKTATNKYRTKYRLLPRVKELYRQVMFDPQFNVTLEPEQHTTTDTPEQSPT